VPRQGQPLGEHRASRPVDPSAPGDDSGVTGDDRDHEDEFDLIGDRDLGVADLGPIAPGTVDPDAGSGRIRKITRAGEHQPR
jgi:hypothetical protein